jgi:DNA-binding beta-propeller fold protein YncE
MIAPESVAYDPVQKRYFISNFGNGNILEIDSLGNKQYFKTGLVKSIGMVIQYNVLYVVSNSKRITGFNLIDTSKSFELTIDEALFLNDITSDNAGNLYVTDSNAKMIYKINKNQESYTLFWNTNLTGPNGILYNKYKHNLIVCNFTENALIQSINLKDSTISVLDSTEFNNLDGLTIDEDGNIYVSLWDSGSFKTGFSHNGSVYKYDNGFQNNPQLIIENLYGPTDIFYNIYKDELVIPLLLGNEVKYVSVEMD